MDIFFNDWNLAKLSTLTIFLVIYLSQDCTTKSLCCRLDGIGWVMAEASISYDWAVQLCSFA